MQMIGIKMHISNSVHYTDVGACTITESLFFVYCLPQQISLRVPPVSRQIIQTIFDLCPFILKHVTGYRSHNVPHAGFQLLEIAFDLVDQARNQTSHDAWLLDRQRSAVCLASQVTRLHHIGLFIVGLCVLLTLRMNVLRSFEISGTLYQSTA